MPTGETPFTSFAFPVVGVGTVPRSMPTRLAEIVNVKDFGPANMNGGSVNATPYIQAAFDAAFKNSSGVPNGVNAHLNRPVYLPAGVYRCDTGLMLTQVRGGRIFGSGQGSTRLIWGGASTGLSRIIMTDGFENSSIENLTLDFNLLRIITADKICLELSVGSLASAVQLNNIAIINMGTGNSRYGTRIADNGFDGRGITLFNSQQFGCQYGLTQNGANSVVNLVGGSLAQCNFGAWNRNGYLALEGQVNYGAYAGDTTYNGQTDLLHDSPGTSIIISGRSESQNMIKISAGKVTATGTTHQWPNVDKDGLAPRVIDGTGGEVTLNGCFIGSLGVPNTGKIAGGGTAPNEMRVNLRNVSWGFDENHFDAGFTGKVVNFIPVAPFTVATLPPNPAEGLMVSVTDANATTWGAGTTGGGTNHALLRYNGTTWTVVGK